MSIQPPVRHRWALLASVVGTATLVGAATVVIVACGPDAPSVDDRTPEEVVHERAQQRWDALLSGDIERAYGFITPAYRATRSLALYRARFGAAVQWNDATVQSVECEAERCRVVVNLSYRLIRQRMENTRPMDEVWVFSEGNWWIQLR
jgi:hypothetical protein